MGNRSTVVRSERNVNRREGSDARNFAARTKCCWGTTTVVSPRNSITSATACLSQSLSFCTAAFLPISCDSTMDPIPDGRLAVPVERALLPEENITNQQDDNVEQHLHKAKHIQLVVNKRPRIQKDRFDIEQNENQGHHVEMNRKGLARVARGGNSAFAG